MKFWSIFFRKPKRVFLDYASTTPISNRVLGVIKPYLSHHFYNPGGLYKEGVDVKKVLNNARTRMAFLLNVSSSEVIFTGSGTESCNLAIRGIFDRAVLSGFSNPHIVTSTIEHSAVLETCRDIENKGGEVTYVEPDEKGIINPEKIKQAIKDNTILVSIMYVNNEIGTIEPIRDISRIVKKWREQKKIVYPFFHTDASQAGNFLPLHVDSLGVDLLTLDSSKVYGPKGVGVLMVKNKTLIKPIIFGGGQEGGLRSGTENIAMIVGAVEAFVEANDKKEKEEKRMRELSKYFIDKIEKEIPQSEFNGHKEKRLPNIVNICIQNIDAEFAVLKLDNLGVSCAHVSACKSSENNSSYVIHALGKKDCAKSSLRFSFGRKTTKKELDFAIKALKRIL